MKRILFAILLLPKLFFAQNSENTCLTISKVNALIQRNHFQPKPIDDSLSVFVFDHFMDELDGNRTLFSKTEYELLSKNRLLVDNYITTNKCAFLDDFIATYKNALNRKKKVLEKLKEIPFDYKTTDSVRFSKKKFPFDIENTGFEKVWIKRIRFDVLEDIAKMSQNSDSLAKNFIAIEKQSKSKIIESNLCKVNSLLENNLQLEKKIKNDFLNSLCNYFDPHSTYFSADAKSSFLSGLSTSNLSLGIQVSLNENEEIVIAEIVPGGPASKNPLIEIGDFIVKVGNNKGTEHWVSCASLESISNLIFSDTNEEIELMLRKINGTTQNVLLKKQVMKAVHNAVFSFVLQKKTKVGYIKIPNFYSDFDFQSIKGCADDVAKEIVKLKKENIEGLIIDLQNNGGGSMTEALKLAGMFINIGPISVLLNQNRQQNVLKDLNRGMVYDGPIIILTNGYSASASEFFAGTLQDYNRALVVGATTLGKASMQSILPLEENNKEDFVKLTIEKFYRISGDSHQRKGIVPDIFMPTLFDSLVKRESGNATALPYDAITTNLRYTAMSKSFSESMVNSSKKRIENNARFKSISNLNIELNSFYNNVRKPIRLRFQDVFSATHERDNLWESVKAISEEENNFKIENNAYDSQKMAFDEEKKEINNFKIKEVRYNPYIDEALNIIDEFAITKP